MPKKTSFRLTARKGTSRVRGKKLQGDAPQSDVRFNSEEGDDVEQSSFDNNNQALVHEREEGSEAVSQDSHEALPEYDHVHISPEGNGKRSVGIQVNVKLPMVSVGLQVWIYVHEIH